MKPKPKFSRKDFSRKAQKKGSPRGYSSKKSALSDKDPEYHNIVQYLDKALQRQAKFYVLKRMRGGVKSIHFDSSQLHGDEASRVVNYLLDAEKSGDRVYVTKPNDEIKRVSFLGRKIVVSPEISIKNDFEDKIKTGFRKS